MLSFQEQHELVNKIRDYEIDGDTINKYITRGNTEEQTYNKRYILGAIKSKLKLIDFSDKFVELVKFYINFFIINNGVYYLNDNNIKVYELPTKSDIIYDAFTNETIVAYEHIPTDKLIFDPCAYKYDAYTNSGVYIAIEYNNPESLKNLDKIVIKDQYVFTDGPKHSPYLKTLSDALKNDDIDLFTDVYTQFPGCVHNLYTYNKYNCIKLFELTVLFNDIKCFKYMLMNGDYDVTHSHGYARLPLFVAISNNFEIVRLLENVGLDMMDKNIWYSSGLIEYHRNDIMKYLMLRYPTNDDAGYYLHKSITSYNYDLMLHILDNYDYIPNNDMWCESSNGDHKHIQAILYITKKYNFQYSSNWLNIIIAIIKTPLSADEVISILKHKPAFIGRTLCHDAWINASKTCLIECFRYNKPYEYIRKIIDFIYGSPEIEYNSMNWYRHEYNRWTYFTPITVLNILYRKHVNVNLVTFIKIMFYKEYNYNEYDLHMIALLMRRKENRDHLKQLTILMEYYTKQFNEFNRKKQY